MSFNPFAEVVDESTDAELIDQAKNGNRDALERLVLRHQAWIYNIAVRMVFVPHDAEEVTQEVLIRAITHLGSFKGDSRFRTWLYRITANHVLNMKRRGGESETQTFSVYAAAINDTPTWTCPIPKPCRWMCRCWSKRRKSPARPGCCCAWTVSSG